MTVSSISPPITQQELEQPRTAAEMLSWVRGAAARFNTKELRAEGRLGKHFARELLDEVLPIAIFADRFYAASPQVLMRYVLGNQNYDATVADSRPSPAGIEFIETTTTLMSYEDSLRMELMNAQGHAPAYGRVRAEGSKHKRVAIHADGMAHEHDKIRAEHLQRILSAVTSKAAKAYPSNTALVVAIDDYTAFESDADRAALDHLAKSSLVPMLGGRNFKVLALEGNQRTHLCYSLA